MRQKTTDSSGTICILYRQKLALITLQTCREYRLSNRKMKSNEWRFCMYIILYKPYDDDTVFEKREKRKSLTAYLLHFCAVLYSNIAWWWWWWWLRDGGGRSNRAAAAAGIDFLSAPKGTGKSNVYESTTTTNRVTPIIKSKQKQASASSFLLPQNEWNANKISIPSRISNKRRTEQTGGTKNDINNIIRSVAIAMMLLMWINGHKTLTESNYAHIYMHQTVKQEAGQFRTFSYSKCKTLSSFPNNTREQSSQ